MRPFHVLSRALAMGVLLAGVAGLGACTDTETKTVFVDRPLFNDPPDTTNGFLGYYNASAGQSTCGNCHVDHQGDWANHGHADAWATLQNSGHAQAFCAGCHTVSELGNAVDSAAGYNLVADTLYHDVQCESCHGPGFDHAKTPDASAPPLARAGADTAVGSGTCGECHNGTHHPYVEQWEASRHAEATVEVVDDIIANPAQYSGTCGVCHEGRSILKAWGVTDNYIERGEVVSHANALGVTCAVCHDPHGSDVEGELRFPIDEPSLDGNLCMKCHARRFEPQSTSSRGPHAPQGPTFLGTAGWFPPGVDTTPQASTHGDPTANPRLCAGCHVARLTINDTSGNFQLQSVGHLFRPIPCLDGQGNPVGGNACGYTANERSWSTCLGAGCHSNTGAVVAAFDANRAVLATFADQIWIDTDQNGTVDATDQGMLATVVAQAPTNQFSTSDGVITVAEGALFNVRLLGENRYANGDKSMGVHNPFLSQKLLAVSISALQAQYAFLPAPPAPVQAAMRQALVKAQAAQGSHARVSLR
jgi:predicted CXXCH cytochrome family protein